MRAKKNINSSRFCPTVIANQALAMSLALSLPAGCLLAEEATERSAVASDWSEVDGVLVRAPTQDEREIMGLGEDQGAWLVVDDLSSTGDERLVLHVPSALGLVPIDLQRTGDLDGVTFVVTTFTGDTEPERLDLSIHVYESEARPGTRVLLGGDPLRAGRGPGGLAGYVESDAGSLRVLGAESSWGVALPEGADLDDLILYIDEPASPLDKKAPPSPNPPGEAVPLGLVGDLQWCEQHRDNWSALLGTIGYSVGTGFRGDNPDQNTNAWPKLEVALCHWTGYGNPDAARDRAKACTLGPAVDEMTYLADSLGGKELYIRNHREGANHVAGADCRDRDDNAYTFANCLAYMFASDDGGESFTELANNYRPGACFRDKAWSAMAQADLYVDLPSLALVQVVQYGTMSCNGNTCAGLSTGLNGQLGPFDPTWTEPGTQQSQWDRAGASAIAGPSLLDGYQMKVATHELGHSFGASHSAEPVAESVEGCEETYGVMVENVINQDCQRNYFSPEGVDEIRNNMELDNCPRSGYGI